MAFVEQITLRISTSKERKGTNKGPQEVDPAMESAPERLPDRLRGPADPGQQLTPYKPRSAVKLTLPDAPLPAHDQRLTAGRAARPVPQPSSSSSPSKKSPISSMTSAATIPPTTPTANPAAPAATAVPMPGPERCPS